MREILFRGKRIDNGEWVEGCYGSHSGIEAFIIDRPYISMNNTLEAMNYYEVDPETVGQYTGLKDSNGCYVFEGDIVEFEDKNAGYAWRGYIVFGNPHGEYSWGFEIVHLEGTIPNTDILLWFDMEDYGAYSYVIGNIHDTPPELIGGVE